MADADARLKQLINKISGRKVVVHYDRKILGKGGYGLVYQATLDVDGDEVAAKELHFGIPIKEDVSKFIEECLRSFV